MGSFWHRDIIIYQTGQERRDETPHSSFTPPQYLAVEFAQSSFTETVDDAIEDDQDNQDHGDDDDHLDSGLKS